MIGRHLAFLKTGKEFSLLILEFLPFDRWGFTGTGILEKSLHHDELNYQAQRNHKLKIKTNKWWFNNHENINVNKKNWCLQIACKKAKEQKLLWFQNQILKRPECIISFLLPPNEDISSIVLCQFGKKKSNCIEHVIDINYGKKV